MHARPTSTPLPTDPPRPTGGWDSSVSGPDAFLGDVWTLDLQSYAWQQQQLAGEVLEGLSRHQAVADGARIFIHSHRCTDHILVLHADASPPRLEKVPVSGEVPSSRGLSSLVKVANALYLFGGEGGGGEASIARGIHRHDRDGRVNCPSGCWRSPRPGLLSQRRLLALTLPLRSPAT
jgi:hypothetical protein